jgi:CO/xanthine dehydrogenase Mo-binding subunit
MRGWGELVYLNESPTTCMRGFGNAEALFGIEQLIDDVARRLDADPLELRMRNATREGQRTMHGWFISSSRLPECAQRVDELSSYRERRRAGELPVARRDSGVHRGVGISFGHHVSGYKLVLKDFDGSSAILRVGIDGVPVLHVGEPDIGQGLSTLLSQIVADGLGVAPLDVRVRDVDTDFSPASVGTLASRATTLAGMATVKAVEAMQRRLVEHAAGGWGVDTTACSWVDGGVDGPDGARASFAEVVAAATRANCGLPVIAEGVFRPDTEWPDESKYGNPSVAYPFCAHVAEVAIDTATGQAALVGYWAVHDSGTIINPMAARSQVVGAIAQGLGWALLEDVVLRDGTMRNANLLDYRIPGAGDMADVVVEFAAGYEPNGPLGAKSLAEAAINPVAAAIANAVYDAVGVRCERLPMSPERIWEALADPDPDAGTGVGAAGTEARA